MTSQFEKKERNRKEIMMVWDISSEGQEAEAKLKTPEKMSRCHGEAPRKLK